MNKKHTAEHDVEAGGEILLHFEEKFGAPLGQMSDHEIGLAISRDAIAHHERLLGDPAALREVGAQMRRALLDREGMGLIKTAAERILRQENDE